MTEWWAFKPISTAFDKARKLLLEPFNAWTWLKLILIVFLAGTGSSRLGSNFSNLFNYQTGPSDSYAIEQSINSLLSNSTLVLILIGLVVLLIAIILIFAYLRNVFSFVFIRAVASGDVSIIKPMMESLGMGFRLFIFTLVVGLLTLAVVVLFILAMILCILLVVNTGVSGAAGIFVLLMAIAVIIILLLLMIAFSLASAIFVGFTYDFVAPMVLFKGTGVVEGWRQLWASIKKDWMQYGVYVLTHWALELAVGIVLMFIVLPLTLIFIAFLLFGAFLAVAAAKTSVILSILIGLFLLAVLVVFVLAVMVVSMPVTVYFRYYSLEVLKLIDPSAVVYSGRFGTPPPPSMLPA